MTIGYVTIGAVDVEAARRFFDATLGALGYERLASLEDRTLYGPKGGEPCIGVRRPYNGRPARAGNGIMVGLKAQTKAQVQTAHAAALAAGGTDEGAPGFRPESATSGFYAAYFRDPVGNKFCAYLMA